MIKLRSIPGRMVIIFFSWTAENPYFKTYSTIHTTIKANPVWMRRLVILLLIIPVWCLHWRRRISSCNYTFAAFNSMAFSCDNMIFHSRHSRNHYYLQAINRLDQNPRICVPGSVWHSTSYTYLTFCQMYPPNLKTASLSSDPPEIPSNSVLDKISILLSVCRPWPCLL